MGYIICQSANNIESLAEMKRKDSGGKCEFDLTKNGLRLLACHLGSKSSSERDSWLHSFIGKSKTLHREIKKNQYIFYAQPFTHLGDCRGVVFILIYGGNNPVIRRIQMDLMGWWFTTAHRPNNMMVNIDY